MSGAAVEPMTAGEQPAETGWYILRHKSEGNEVVYVIADHGTPAVLFSGSDDWGWLDRMADAFIFIARIYPDRIEWREG